MSENENSGVICFGSKKLAELEDIWNRPDSGRARYWQQRARFKSRRRIMHPWIITGILGLQDCGRIGPVDDANRDRGTG